MMRAIFAAGCFWGVQYYFDQIPGVLQTTVGYIGGETTRPTYDDVCHGDTGHAEAVEIRFDATIISYERLVRHFFRMHDPTQHNRQGRDVGSQYRSAVFYIDNNQKRLAMTVRDSLQPSYDRPIVTQIVPATQFYKAEEYHQKFTVRTGRGMCHIPYTPIE